MVDSYSAQCKGYSSLHPGLHTSRLENKAKVNFNYNCTMYKFYFQFVYIMTPPGPAYHLFHTTTIKEFVFSEENVYSC